MSDFRKVEQQAKRSLIGNRDGPRSVHSQTTSTLHPVAVRATNAFPSRSRLPSIFVRQNSGRVACILHSAQPCPCQKHPRTKITARRPGKTKSGRPGRSLRCIRKRHRARADGHQPQGVRVSGECHAKPSCRHLFRRRLPEREFGLITVLFKKTHDRMSDHPGS